MTSSQLPDLAPVGVHQSNKEKELILIYDDDAKTEIYTMHANHSFTKWDKQQTPRIVHFTSSAFDAKTNSLYLLDGGDRWEHVPGIIYKIDISNKSCKSTSQSFDNHDIFCMREYKFLCISNNKLAAYASLDVATTEAPSDVSVWDCNLNYISSHEKSVADIGSYMYGADAVVHVKNSEIAYLFGNMRTGERGQGSNGIMRRFTAGRIYVRKLLSSVAVSFMHSLVASAVVCTNDGRYIIILGGFYQRKERCANDIYYTDVEGQKIMKNVARCRSGDKMKEYVDKSFAVIPRHEVSDEMSVSGFIRNLWKEKGFDEIRYPPQYLIEIISGYYQNEMLYLFRGNNPVWMINTDEILKCMT